MNLIPNATWEQDKSSSSGNEKPSDNERVSVDNNFYDDVGESPCKALKGGQTPNGGEKSKGAGKSENKFTTVASINEKIYM